MGDGFSHGLLHLPSVKRWHACLIAGTFEHRNQKETTQIFNIRLGHDAKVILYLFSIQ